MALGDQAGLQAVQTLTATFPGLLAAIGGDADKLTAALAQIEQDAITRAGSVIQADLAPLIQESQLWRGQFMAMNAKLDRLMNSGLLLTVPKT